jgi:serine/threonine protein kinase
MSAESDFLKKHGWKVLGPVGSGGNASVFKVREAQNENGPTHAAKVLRKRDTRPQARQRFVQEIEALRKIDHPSVVKVISPIEDEEQWACAYVMEFVEGLVPLKDLVGRTRTVPANPFFENAERALTIYTGILEGLQACEKEGIVHRDLSLGNILVTPDHLHVKIIDFGCCHKIDGETITLSDEAVGTVGYRAPECSGHSAVEPAIQADLYSAGKILWSIVTDQMVFEREEPVFKGLALNRKLPDAPETWHLHHVFAKTIRHDPTDRYKNASKAIEDARFILDRIRGGYPPLEKLDNKLCPVCGIGRLYLANYLMENKLIDHETEKKLVDDAELHKEIGQMQREVRGFVFLCRYCGFGCFWSDLIRQRNLKHRETLK